MRFYTVDGDYTREDGFEVSVLDDKNWSTRKFQSSETKRSEQAAKSMVRAVTEKLVQDTFKHTE